MSFFPNIVQIRKFESILAIVFDIESAKLIDEIKRCLRWQRLAQDEVLYQQDSPCHDVYFLIAGRLHTHHRPVNGLDGQFNELVSGDILGYIALFSNEPHIETVIAIRDSLLAKISGDDIERLSFHYPELLFRVSKLMAKQSISLINKTPQPTPKVSNIVVYPAHNDIDTNDFSATLAQFLRRYGRTSIITRSTLERSAYTDLEQLLWHEREQHHYFLIIADLDDSPWTQKCFNQADKFFILTDDTGKTEPRSLEQSLFKKRSQQAELVIIHTGKKNHHIQTSGYLKNRNVVKHHHIAKLHREDYARLARYLNGNSIGLVMAGGGARGFVHIGVYQALYERNIPIDRVAGTSMGAIFAGAIAMGVEPDELINAARSFFVSRNPVKDYTFPFVSLVSGHVLDTMLKEFFFVYDIEDCWIDFFCVAGNLTESTTEIIRQGPMWHAVRASISLPGIFPPIIKNGNLLVDGGVVNNFPVDAMKPFQLGTCIGVNLNSKEHRKYDFNEFPSTLQHLKNRLTKANADQRIPGITTILSKSALLSSAQQSLRNIELTDIYLHPNVDDVGLLEFSAFEKLIQRGYTHTLEVLDNLPADKKTLLIGM